MISEHKVHINMSSEILCSKDTCVELWKKCWFFLNIIDILQIVIWWSYLYFWASYLAITWFSSLHPVESRAAPLQIFLIKKCTPLIFLDFPFFLDWANENENFISGFYLFFENWSRSGKNSGNRKALFLFSQPIEKIAQKSVMYNFNVKNICWISARDATGCDKRNSVGAKSVSKRHKWDHQTTIKLGI